MGVRRDIEADLFPSETFDYPTKIYDRLATIVAADTFSASITQLTEATEIELGLTFEDITDARKAAVSTLAFRMANYGAFEDFRTGTSNNLVRLANHVRRLNEIEG